MPVPRSAAAPAPALALVVAVLLSACGGAPPGEVPPEEATASFQPITATPPSSVPAAPVSPEVETALTALAASPLAPPPGTVDTVAASGDPRLAWVLADLLRIGQDRDTEAALVRSLTALVGAPPPDGQDPWVAYSDVLARWDVSAPDGYPAWKRAFLLAYEPRWEPILGDVATEGLDWRTLAPSPVAPDAVAALAAPPMVRGEAAAWLPSDDRVVGVVVDGEPRAYPLRVLAAHEVVEDRAGDGTRLAVVHDTVSGTIAVYADPSRRSEGLGVSGLMADGVDLLYDTASSSLVDPVTGSGVTGSWWSSATRLERVAFTLTTWREWRQAHPSSLVVAEDGGIGRVYLKELWSDLPVPPRALGEVDGRLGAASRVLALERPDGSAAAFPLELVEMELVRGRPVALNGVSVSLEAGGLVAEADGERVAAVITSWADWSRVHPESGLWEGSS